MANLSGGETLAANRFIYGKLNTGVGAGKVFPALAPRGTAMPFIVYQFMPLPGTSDTVALGGIRVLTTVRYLVKVQAATLASAEPLLMHLDTLHNTNGQSGPYYVINVERSAPYEMPTVEGEELYWQTGGLYDLTIAQGL